MTRTKLAIFTDASFDPASKCGVVGAVIIDENVVATDIRPVVETKVFRNTTNTRLELQAILWALKKIRNHNRNIPVTLYTDCKTAVDLPKRRTKLESRKFKTVKGLDLNNGDMYIRFFSLFDEIMLKIIWVKGHKPSPTQNAHEKILSLVDKTTRRSLREMIKPAQP